MTNAKPFSAEKFKELYSRVPRLCVDLVIESPDGLVLALRSLPEWNNQWHFPGGTVFYKESLLEAAARVAKDEAGIDVTVKKVLGYMEFPSEERERGFGWSVSIALLCSTDAREFHPRGDDASSVRAFTSLPDNMIAEHRAFLAEQGLYANL